jgi:hypothetical protein
MAAPATLEGAIGACIHKSATPAFEGEMKDIGKALAPGAQVSVNGISKAANDRVPSGIIDLLGAEGHKDYVVTSAPSGNSYDSAKIAAQLFNQHYILNPEAYSPGGYIGGIAYMPKAANQNIAYHP